MKYGIFDSRSQFCKKPYVFHDEVSGEQEPAIFDDKEKAEKMAMMMNHVTSLTIYVVKVVNDQ